MIKVRLARNGDDNDRDWLAGDPLKSQALHSGVEGGQAQHQRSVQEIGGAGWTHSRYLDRGNERSDKRFTTSRLFATTLECWQWMNSFARESPEDWPHGLVGDIIERFEEGGVWQEERFHGAVLQKPQMSFEGRTLRLAYSYKFRYSSFNGSGAITFLAADDDADALVFLTDDTGVFLSADTPD
ncbi:hypothetical protein GCM10023213_13960 [Prosthecobacter algae]|uniref:Uncharacterized protein n=1 Tax=Prosthecobacter algae TaxID=1144682 RepID=A0ABP9P275_9BACT